MEPVVNGLEAKYRDRIAFQYIDANSQGGQTAFRAYRLQGHPAYVLINPDGEVLWTGLGEQIGENLENDLRARLENP